MVEELKPCPFCGSAEHLTVNWVGSMTSDMPDRPYRVICTHIDHDTLTGPIAYGRYAAVKAWNSRHVETPTPDGTGSGEGGKLAALVASLTDDEIHVVEDLRSLAEHAGRGSRIQNTCREAANMIEARALSTPKRDEEQAGEHGRSCTCHHSERPSMCQHRYALTECLAAAHKEQS